MVMPMGLVKRVGDRSVILHWDPAVAPAWQAIMSTVDLQQPGHSSHPGSPYATTSSISRSKTT